MIYSFKCGRVAVAMPLLAICGPTLQPLKIFESQGGDRNTVFIKTKEIKNRKVRRYVSFNSNEFSHIFFFNLSWCIDSSVAEWQWLCHYCDMWTDLWVCISLDNCISSLYSLDKGLQVVSLRNPYANKFGKVKDTKIGTYTRAEN